MGFRNALLVGGVMVAQTVMGAEQALTVDDYDAFNDGSYGTLPNITYQSTNISSPLFQVSTWDKDRVDKTPYMIWPPSTETGSHPSIFSSEDLSLVWQGTSWESTINARVQMYKDEPYITFTDTANSRCVMLDKNYNLAYTIETTVEGEKTDMHECQLTGDGTAIVTVYQDIPYDLTPVDGPANGTLSDSLFEEIDIESGERVMLWRASDHVAITEMDGSYTEGYGGMTSNPGGDNGPLDYFHINSIEKVVPEGNYLVSGRRCKLLLYVDSNGDRIWQVGGDRNDFEDLSGGNATNFGYQHHARFTEDGGITMFDNHEVGTATSPGCTGNCSRGLHLSMDYEAMTASVISEFYHPKSVQSFAMGGYDLLSNGNSLVGWGQNPAITEHAPDGSVVLDIQIAPWADSSSQPGAPGGNATLAAALAATAPEHRSLDSNARHSRRRRSSSSSSLPAVPEEFQKRQAGGGGMVQSSAVYRVFKTEWKGFPQTVPDVAVAEDAAAPGLYVSWNGATEVQSWAVYGSNVTASLRPVGEPQLKTGFETLVTMSNTPCLYAQVAALAADGEELARSSMMNMDTGKMLSA